MLGNYVFERTRQPGQNWRMKKLLFIPVVLSLLVLGAHFMRDGNDIGVAISVGLIGLLFVKRPGAARIVQVALLIGALEWVWTIYTVSLSTALRWACPQRG